MISVHSAKNQRNIQLQIAIRSISFHCLLVLTKPLCDTEQACKVAGMFLNYYSSGPNRSVVLNKRGGWTIYPKLINVWTEISMWSDFSMTYLKEFCTKN